MRSYNIIFIGTLPPHPGGSAISCFQLLLALAERGHSIRSIAPITKKHLEQENDIAIFYPELSMTRYIVPHFNVTPNIPPRDKYLNTERTQIEEILMAQVARDWPDIIISGRESFAWYVPDIAKKLGLPCIQMVRGNPTYGLLDETYPEKYRICLKRCMQKADIIVSNACHLALGLANLGFKNILTIQNFVDLSRFSPRRPRPELRKELNIDSQNIVCGFVSNIKPKKRPFEIIQCAKMVLHKNPRLIFLIVGDGELRCEMEARCEKLGIRNRFRFTGWVDYDQMPDYISLTDMVIVSSEAEAIARVYLETQASAKTLIASDIPGAREVIKDGETGLIYSLGDIQEMANKVIALAENPDMRKQIGQAAYEWVKDNHSLARVADQYISMFDSFLSHLMDQSMKKSVKTSRIENLPRSLQPNERSAL